MIIICPECFGYVTIEVDEYETITHDMAADAGDPGLEGKRIQVSYEIRRETCGGCVEVEE